MNQIKKVEDGIAIKNDKGQLLYIFQSSDGDLHFTSGYEYPSVNHVGHITTDEFMQLNELVIIDFNQAEPAYQVLTDFIKEYVTKSPDKRGVLNQNTIILTDDDTPNGAIIKFNLTGDQASVIFCYDGDIDHQSLRVRGGGGKYVDNLIPIHNLFHSLANLGENLSRKRTKN